TAGIVVNPVLYDRVRLAVPAPVIGDLDIASSVREALRADPRFGELVPQVEVLRGVATLTGVLATGAARGVAEQTARDTAGVRNVLDETRVAYVPTASDADVLRAAGDALRATAGVQHPEALALDVSRGVLMVRGRVRSVFERALVHRAL